MELEVIKGDITKMEVDAIVNAANKSLKGGGGVDGAIHRAGGKEILDECKAIVEKQGKCPTGEAVITTAGKLPSKYVIHTVGPVWNGGKYKEEEKLESCYRNSLDLAVENDCRTVAFPNISTSAYRFPKAKAAEIAVATVKNYPQSNLLDKVIFVCYDEENLKVILLNCRI